MSLLLPVCTFLRVFDTVPMSEVLTLPELIAALRRFELKPQTVAKIEREVARIRQAAARTLAGEPPRGKYMGKLHKEAEKAKKEGRDLVDAITRLALELEEDARRGAKRDLRLWSPALYRPGADKRGSENVTHVSCLVLDYDDGTPIADASDTFRAFFHIVHTTWSHTPEHPKFRLIMPLAFPVPSEDWPKVWSWAEEITRFEIDPAMKSPAATYALPAVPHRAWPREAFSRPGAILDPVDEGILERRSVLTLAPKRPPEGVPSVIRGEDPEHEYIDHEDPDAVYFLDEPWAEEDEWEPPPELALAASRSRDASSPRVDPPAPREDASDEERVNEARAERESPVIGEPSAPAPASDAQEAQRGWRTDELAHRLESALDRLDRLAQGAPIVDALERLVALHREGWLSLDELAEAKRRVLSDPEPGELRRIGKGRHRRTLAVDFDGVIHSYASGWKGATSIPDPPVDGAIAWLTAAIERFDVAILSVRSSQPGAVDAMRAWMRQHGLPGHVVERITFPVAKPPAELYIDDRAFRFEGTFPSFDALADLEPWTRKRS